MKQKRQQHQHVTQKLAIECLISNSQDEFVNGCICSFLLWCLQDECANFIRLIEPWNRTQLYVCGTGAYNPVCTFVNRGRKPQVSVTDYSVNESLPQSPSVAHQLIRQLPSWLALHWLDATLCSCLTMMLVTVSPLSLSPLRGKHLGFPVPTFRRLLAPQLSLKFLLTRPAEDVPRSDMAIFLSCVAL